MNWYHVKHYAFNDDNSPLYMGIVQADCSNAAKRKVMKHFGLHYTQIKNFTAKITCSTVSGEEIYRGRNSTKNVQAAQIKKMKCKD